MYYLHILIIIVFAFISGCGVKNADTANVLVIGGTLPTKPEQPDVLILEPSQKIKVKKGEKIRIVVQLKLKSQEDIPHYIGAHLYKNAQQINGVSLTPTSRIGNLCLLESKLRAVEPGRNRIKIEILYLIKKKYEHGDDSQVPPLRVQYGAWGPDVEVIR